VSGQLLQKPRMKSSGVCVVSCTAFRGSDRFTAIVLIRQRQAALETQQMQILAKTVEANYPTDKYERILIECPACGQQGLVSGSYDVDWEVDCDRDGNIEGAYPVVTMTASHFGCDFCDLALEDSTELKAAGIPTLIHIEDPDPRDFYEEPDY
jgi:hypothetical protein